MQRGPSFRIVLLLSLLLVADATVLFAHFGRAYAGPDAPGYFQARLLATEGAAAWLLGTLPAMLEHALSGFAHIPVMFLLLVGLYLLDRWWLRGNSAGRKAPLARSTPHPCSRAR